MIKHWTLSAFATVLLFFPWGRLTADTTNPPLPFPTHWTPFLTCDDGRGAIDTLVFFVNEYEKRMIKAEIYRQNDIIRRFDTQRANSYELAYDATVGRFSLTLRNPIYSEADFAGYHDRGVGLDTSPYGMDELNFIRNLDERTIKINYVLQAYTRCTGTVDSDGMCRGGEYVTVPAEERANWIFRNCHAW